MSKMKEYATPETDGIVVELDTNDLIEEITSNLIKEAISHFNKIKNKVRDAEGDARYVYSKSELDQILSGIIYPDRVWVSTVTDDHGNFFAYRIGRVITMKKGTKQV